MSKAKGRQIVFPNALITGFFGGALLSSIYIAFHYFNVTKVSHRHILSFFSINGAWVQKWYGYLLFILIISSISVILAIIYYVLFRKIKGWLVGAGFGICLWLIFGLFIPIFAYEIFFIEFYKTYTNVLNFCAFLIYGIFIGYSISYDEEMRKLDIDHE